MKLKICTLVMVFSLHNLEAMKRSQEDISAPKRQRINKNIPLTDASKATMLHLILERGTPLDLWTFFVEADMAEDFIQKELNRSYDKRSVIHDIVENDTSVQKLGWILDHGAEPNSLDNSPDGRGTTPLFKAVERNDNVGNEMIDKLLLFGADPNLSDDDELIPLHSAVSVGNFYAIKKLIEAGSDKNKISVDYQTPLDVALENPSKLDKEISDKLIELLRTQDAKQYQEIQGHESSAFSDGDVTEHDEDE